MKTVLSLLITVILLMTVIGTVPTVFAEEFKYPLVSEEIRIKYWSGTMHEGVVKIGDWYYGLNTNSSTKEKYINAVCGYDGNETEITIPTEIDGYIIDTIKAFHLFSNTVEIIKIPKGITSIKSGYDRNGNTTLLGDETYFSFEGTTKLKEIIVDSENEKFMSKDGVIFSKSGYTLYFYPPKKLDVEYTVPSIVGKIETGALWYQR